MLEAGSTSSATTPVGAADGTEGKEEPVAWAVGAAEPAPSRGFSTATGSALEPVAYEVSLEAFTVEPAVLVGNLEEMKSPTGPVFLANVFK